MNLFSSLHYPFFQKNIIHKQKEKIYSLISYIIKRNSMIASNAHLYEKTPKLGGCLSVFWL